MPSIVHLSPTMTSRRLAMVSQDLTEQSNGLVEFAVTYSAAASDRAHVLPLFKTDAPPPIKPTIIDYGSLQTQNLYLKNFSASQANGLMEINASYVGANFTALKSPAIFSDFETFNFNVQIAAYYENITGAPGQESSATPRFDFYGFDCNLRVEEQQAAVIERHGITFAPPPAFAENNREGLVMGAVFSRRIIYPHFLVSRDTPLDGFRYRSMSASDILAEMAKKQPDGTAGFSVVKTQKVDHITPSVRIVSYVYEAELNTSALFNLGFIVT